MRVPRRRFLHMVGAAIALGGSRQAAKAQAYPSRPVHLIVGFPASGLTDILARLLGTSLSEQLGQQFTQPKNFSGTVTKVRSRRTRFRRANLFLTRPPGPRKLCLD